MVPLGGCRYDLASASPAANSESKSEAESGSESKSKSKSKSDAVALVDPRSAKLGAVVDSSHDAGLFDGAVLVADDAKVLYQRAAGPADREARRANAVPTRYPIASLTKQFTAVLVMQHVERGGLELDAPIGSVLPWFREDVAETIRIRDLLMHTSGLPDVSPEVYLDADPDGDLRDLDFRLSAGAHQIVVRNREAAGDPSRAARLARVALTNDRAWTP